ncbi:Anti-anti-sigma regulatory factor (antagonist of anti-sigma factor) [Mesobacillus persicus]|uniref:Anti-anti-sigma regulatory factor (Antagonist of anti-sigma factor) n=1 Tax=Mesobacillus persicus TaxID=930146 RepID=A0A1H7VQI3_9BACI|nr:STAS domain-containing protein [Mesobacillus persicus]SEM11077.1 Anti-anti-sigma regulatory factor (antagonist of anti-sigma factor) [Mesobacillus persicus]
MDLTFNSRDYITEFIVDNKPSFEKKLLSEAVNVASKIKDILKTGNIDLLANAQKLVLYAVEQKEDELVKFAEQEGIVWAKHSLTLAFKLEWVQAIRRTLWYFLYQFDRLTNKSNDLDRFYTQEKRINDQIDQFLNNFFLSYSHYKDELISEQRKLVEHLSVPIIPVSSNVSVLPLIGMIDSYRIKTIEEKVLMEIADLKVQTLIIDLSGIVTMEKNIIDHFQKILNGISMMGCESVLTGLRPELVKNMIHSGISFRENVETRGTLQLTLKKFLEVEVH